MKKIFTLIFTIFIAFSVSLVSGCSNNSLPAIDLNTYFKNSISTVIYKNDISSTKSMTLDLITGNNSDSSKMDKYYSFTLTANASWIYKMYIEKIEFYVITNESVNSEMTFTLSMTNLAPESNLSNMSKYTELKSHTAKANESYKYTFEIKKVVAASTGTTITIDIAQSDDLLSTKINSENNFNWQLYGFKIYGESREYLK